MLANSFGAFLSFWALILVGFFLLYLEAAFTSARFFQTANISHRTLGLALCLVYMHSTAASKWALTKFSYSSLGVGVSDISWSASNLFLSIKVYLSLISLLLSRDQSKCSVVIVVRAAFLRRFSRIFAMTIRWSEDTPSKEEYAFSIQCSFIPVHIYKDVVYLCFSIVCVDVDPYFSFSFLKFNIEACKSISLREIC